MINNSKISTKRTITSHLNSLNTKRPWYMMLKIHVKVWDRHKTVARLNRLIGPLPSLLLVLQGSNVLVNKRSENLHRFTSTQKTTYCHKWQDKIDWLIYLFNATFNNISAISWRPVVVVEEAGVPGENHRPWASNW